ncbi:MAG: GIY-YIG nuclease family protein [Planctomycetota bacterium]
MAELQIVYVLTNPAMPSLVKIGQTSSMDVKNRLVQLYTTGVPFPFKLEFACKVSNSVEVEKALHQAFAPYRVNPSREFFAIEPNQAIAILRLLHTEDATVEFQSQAVLIDSQYIAAAEQFIKRRPNLNFDEMGIPTGSVLNSIHNDMMVIVAGPRTVRLGDDQISLTAATRQVLQIDYSVNPCRHWTYQGKNLNDIYNDTYQV